MDCTNDEITAVTGENDDTYYFDDAAQTYQPTASNSKPTCPIVYSITVDGSSSFNTNVFSLNQNTGVLTINADAATYESTYDKNTYTIEYTI